MVEAHGLKPQQQCQGIEISLPLAPRKRYGPGTVLTAILHKLKFRAAAGCKCRARAREMNIRGADWCEENLETIVGWLREEYDRLIAAGKAPLVPFSVIVVRKLIRRAIKISRARAS